MANMVMMDFGWLYRFFHDKLKVKAAASVQLAFHVVEGNDS